MKVVWWSVLLSSLCAVGCGPAARQATFNEAEYLPYGHPGSASIAGQAFLKTRSGDVKYGAGNDVYLNPVTSYSTEWWNRSVVRGEKLEPPDDRAGRYLKTVIADGEGRFEFKNLPPGDYYVFCPVYWEVPAGYVSSITGGNTGVKVSLKSGERANVILRQAK